MSKRSRKEKGHEAQSASQGEAMKADGDSGPEKWIVLVLEAARKEGHKILSDIQYEHVVEILKRLVDFGNPEEIGDLVIEPIESFYELKEKGGILGRINLRVYFGTIPDRHELVIAKAYKKEDDHAVPRHVVLLVEDRLEGYKASGLRKSVTVYEKVESKK